MKPDWQKYEEQIAKERGGRTTVSSGRKYYDKSDGKDKIWGWDCKTTKSLSYTVTRKEWEKLESDLLRGEGLKPCIQIKLDMNSNRPLELVVLDKNDFYELLEEAENG